MSEVIDVTGIAMYARVFEHNRDLGSQPGDKYEYPEATSLDLIVDQDTLKQISAVFPDVQPKVTDDGLVVKFKRKWNNPKPERGGPPVVKDADGNPWDDSILIGNGSKVRVAAEIFQHKYGKSMRLLGVQVLELEEAGTVQKEPELPF